jgi:hypothetical protein
MVLSILGRGLDPLTDPSRQQLGDAPNVVSNLGAHGWVIFSIVLNKLYSLIRLQNNLLILI